jgi:hypothetical protein
MDASGEGLKMRFRVADLISMLVCKSPKVLTQKYRLSRRDARLVERALSEGKWRIV